MASPPKPEATERVFLARPEGVPEVEVFAVENSGRLWRAYHETYAVCTCLPSVPRAAAEWRYRRRTYATRPGGLMLMEPGEVHVTTKVHGVGTFRVLLIRPEYVKSIAAEMDLSGAPHLGLATTEDAWLYSASVRLHAALRDSSVTALERQVRLAECLRGLLQRSAQGGLRRQAPPSARSAARRAVDYLRAFHAERVTLGDLSRAVGLSKFHLARCFAREVGVAPHEYLLLVRIERVRELLAEGVAPAIAAAIAGFADQSHLTRVFKQRLGTTPGWYRTSADAERLRAGVVVPTPGATASDLHSRRASEVGQKPSCRTVVEPGGRRRQRCGYG
jgi:AraC-like DNA-binding protein